MAIEIAPPDAPDSRRRRRAVSSLWRLCGWGGAAAIALAALAITTQSESGSERLQLAFASGNPPPLAVEIADMKRRALEKDAETQRLETQVLTLAADRDRLTARLTSLERNLDDMTGSIKRQAALATEAAIAKASPPPTAQTPAPAVAQVPTTVRTETYTPPPASAPAQTAAATSETVPLPPTRMAAAPASEPAAEPPRKPEFGVDLGGAPTMDVLSARWAAVKANFGPLLTGLHPLATHDRRPGSTDFRLLAGPLPTAAAATQLCARFVAARVTCRTAKFDGQRLAQQ